MDSSGTTGSEYSNISSLFRRISSTFEPFVRANYSFYKEKTCGISLYFLLYHIHTPSGPSLELFSPINTYFIASGRNLVCEHILSHQVWRQLH